MNSTNTHPGTGRKITMPDADRKIILKLLNGTQSGAEVALSDGVYSFGSGEEADLRMIDIAMPELQGRIRVTGGKIALQALGASLATASGLVIDPGGEDWREIAQLDVVTAGTTRFALGVKSANWAELLSEEDGLVPRRPTESKGALAGFRHWKWPLSAAGFVILLGLGVAGLALQSPDRLPGDAAAPNIQAVIATLRATLDRLPFSSHLDVSAQADGRLIVTGYVAGATERRAVEGALSDTGIAVRRRIWALDAMQADIDGLLAAQETAITAKLTPDGHVTLTGVHLDPEEARTIVEMIQSQVFGLSGVTNDISTAETYLAEVQDLINRLSLTNLVIARLDGMLIETTGVIPAEKADNWVGFVQVYAKRFSQTLPLRSFVTLENAPPNTAAEPLMVGKSEVIASLGGRQLSAQSLSEGSTLGPDEVFGPSLGPDGGPGASNAATEPPAPNTDAQSVPNRTSVPPFIQSVISDYAAKNPAVVDAIIASASNGQVTSLSALQSGQFLTAPDVSGADNPAPRSVAPGTIAALISEGAPTAGQAQETTVPAPERQTEQQANPPAEEPTAFSTEARVAGTSAPTPPTANDGYQRFEAGLPDTPEVRSLMAASTRLFTPGPEGGFELSQTASSVLPGLRQLSPDLLDLAQEQQKALGQGQTLIRGPRPLSAQPYRPDSEEGRCWNGGSLHAEQLPAVMLWLDILSLGGDTDLSGFDETVRRTILEAALSPTRLRACLLEDLSPFSMRLEASSSFLQETRRNDRFAEYIFRDTPRFPLVMSGVDLSGDRYVMLENGRKLYEGSAPTLGSRVVSIGDLGILLRLSSGYQVALYPERMRWRVSAAR